MNIKEKKRKRENIYKEKKKRKYNNKIIKNVNEKK